MASVDGIMLSLNMDWVFVEGDMMRNKVDGILGCERRPGIVESYFDLYRIDL